MKGNVFALIVHSRPEPCDTLKLLLRRLGIDTFSVDSCADAAHLLEQTQPSLVFTDTKLPDGTWIDLLNLVEDAPLPVSFILIGSLQDSGLRRTALGYGAFDYLASPFEIDTVADVLDRAIRFVQAGRQRIARTAVA